MAVSVPLWERPQVLASEYSEASVSGLSDRQKWEKDAISAIFEEAVSERPSNASAVEGWAPVLSYLVSLSAQSGSGANNSDQTGPTADLEVQYGHLYPLETPMLRLHNVEGLPKHAQEELHKRIWEEVTKNAGKECIFEVCTAVSDLLRAYSNPADSIDLHSLMIKNEQEKERREQERREEELRQKAVLWENEKRADQERLERYQAKLQAVQRVGEAGRAGNTDFLPDERKVAVSPRTGPAAKPASPRPATRLSPPASPRPATSPQLKKTRSPKLSPPGSPKLKKILSPQQNTSVQKPLPIAAINGKGYNGLSGASPQINVSSAGLDFELVISERCQGASGSSDFERSFMLDDGSSVGVVFEASEAAPVTKPAHDSTCKPEAELCPSFGHGCNFTVDDVAGTSGQVKKARMDGNNENAMQGASPQSLSVGGAVSSTAAGGRFAADFEQLAFLGKGGFGSVTKVRHRLDRNLYAVKRIELKRRAKERERILQECALLPQMHHMHIVRYYQAWIESEQVLEAVEVARGGRNGKTRAQKHAVRKVIPRVLQEGDDWLSHPGTNVGWDEPRAGQITPPATTREFLYIQMEFCDGTWTLRELIDSGALLEDENRIWKIFRQVLDALAYVHSKGLIHRDLKPANVFLSREDGYTAKLGDFGLTVEVGPSASQQVAGENREDAVGQSNAHVQQSTGVGTIFYMAPEVRAPQRRETKKKRASVIRAQAYDQKADMFSLGVMLFEMWHPPFSTGMERAEVLGRLHDGLIMEDSPPCDQVRMLLPSDPKAPDEAFDILGYLLLRDPELRPSADWFLNESGLLPAGAFDPQVQRILKALENPSSGESVALIKALFARSEDAAKELSFFKQLFHFRTTSASEETEAEMEARDWLMRIFCELCRKHGAVSERCPLLRPVRQARTENISGQVSGPTVHAYQIVDAGNTLVELRTTLTEPLSRVAAATLACDRAEGEGCSNLTGVRRHYHTGAVYRDDWDNWELSRYGHPREVSSAAVQFLWLPPSSKDAPSFSQRLKANAEQIHQVELLHLVAEILAISGLSGRAELRLTDMRLLPLLCECAAHQYGDAKLSSLGAALGNLPRERSASPAPVPKSEKSRARLSEAFRNAFASAEQSGKSLPTSAASVIDRLASEFADSHGQKPATVLLKELEQLYAPLPGSSVESSGAAASCPATDRLREVLASLRSVAKAVEGFFDVALDVLQPVDRSIYGPGLLFRICVRDVGIVCAGGRVDGLLQNLAELHSGGTRGLALGAEEETEAALPQTLGHDQRLLHGVSVEFAVDKVAAALVQSTQMPHALSWRRRQVPGCRPHVLLSTASEDDGDEVLKVASGLWKLGLRCEVTCDAVDTEDCQWALEARSDFILELQRAPASPLTDISAVTPSAEEQHAGTQEDLSRSSLSSASISSKDKRAPVLRYSVRAVSDLGHDLLDDQRQHRATKDGGNLNSEEQQKLLHDFFEKLSRKQQRQFSELGLDSLLEARLEAKRQPRAGKERVCEFEDEQRVLDFFDKLSRKQQCRPPGLAAPFISEHLGEMY